MLGLQDGWVAAAFVLCFVSAAVCVVYGATHWNKGDHQPDAEDKHWAEDEEKLEQDL